MAQSVSLRRAGVGYYRDRVGFDMIDGRFTCLTHGCYRRTNGVLCEKCRLEVAALTEWVREYKPFSFRDLWRRIWAWVSF